MKKNHTAIFTIVSNNYLHFARTLLQSARKHQTSCDFYCVIVDNDISHAEQLASEFNIIKINALNIEHLQQFIFQYTVLELNTAVKPWAMETLLSQGYKNVIYIDPDIKIYQPLNEVVQALAGGADIIITPHLLAPMTDNLSPTELDIRRAGTYNFGFCGVKNCSNALAFIKWWQSKLYRSCIINLDKGIFVDQSWIDLVPGMFQNVSILKHPGYNVAYWNLAQRKVKFDNRSGTWLSNSQPLVFFHYSGLNPLKPDNFSKHQNRFSFAKLGSVKPLAQDYVDNLIQNGAKHYSNLKYDFAFFSDGILVPDALRKLYLTDEVLRNSMGNNPFDRSDVLLSPTPTHYSVAGNLIFGMYILWSQREDLKRTFNVATNEGVKGFTEWFANEGKHYYEQNLVEKMLVAQDITLQDKHLIEVNPALLETIFYRVLGRPPGQRAKTTLTKFTKNRFLAIICLLIVVLTAESRSKPNIFRRFLYGVYDIVKYKASSEPSANYQPMLTEEVKYGRFDGLYFNESGIAKDGIWAKPIVVLPIPDNQLASYELSINFPHHYHADNNQPCILKIFLDNALIETIALTHQSIVTIRNECTPDKNNHRHLILKCNSQFIPSALGLGNDDRVLSYRISKATINQIDVVDASKNPPILDIKNLYRNFGVNLIGYLAAELGVGEAARTMAKSMNAASIAYSIVDVGYQSPNRQNDKSAWLQATKEHFDIDMLYVNADQVPNSREYLRQIQHKHTSIKIGFWHWEQTKLPERLLSSFEGLDEIWVPSAFVQEAVSSISPIPVFKVPHAVAFDIQQHLNRSAFNIPHDRFAVLVMYDFHSYRFRKNPEAAIEAFNLATKQNKSMTLVIKTINAHHYAEDYNELKNKVSHLPSVIFIDEVYSNDKIRALQKVCDCLISLHRAEGFGFAPAEMMFLGKPVIATGWSGNMEFMTPMNSFPINYTLKKLERNVGVYESGLEWAEADVEHASYCLTQVINDKNLYERISKLARATLVTHFNPSFIGEQYKQRIALLKSRK